MVSQAAMAHDCILFATADWDEPYWTNKQHTATALSLLGWRVLYVESVGLRAPSMASTRDWSRLWRRLRMGVRCLFFGPVLRQQNIWVLSPLLIPAGHHWPLIGLLNRWLLQSAIRRFVARHSFSSTWVWTYHPFMLSAVQRILHGPVLYHCVDDLGAVPGVDKAAFSAFEEALLKVADVVFVTARALEERCRKFNSNTHFLSNVADANHFGRALESNDLPSDLAGIPVPRLVYHGVLSDFKVDFDLLIKSARLRPDWHWVLIGEQREGQESEMLAELSVLPNVHLLGYRAYAELPEYLRGMDVGLLPTLVNDYTRSMFPMKFYEYLAAGLPVVSTPLDFTRDPLPGLETGSTVESFTSAIERQLANGKLSPTAARQAVGVNTWQGRLATMIQIVEAEPMRATSILPVERSA
jgi:glycosyltransferase involved in cell wall biosynthesis